MKGIKALELCTASGWTETPQSVLFLTVDLEYRSHQKAINKLANWLRITASLEVYTFITISLVLFVFNQNANAIPRWGKNLKTYLSHRSFSGATEQTHFLRSQLELGQEGISDLRSDF